MTATRFASFALLIAATATAQAAPWTSHKYETDGFAVEFSGDVAVKPIDVNAETQAAMVRSTSYLQDGGAAYAYLVGASLFKPDANFDFDAGVKGTMDSYKCKVTKSDVSPTGIGDRAREIRSAECVDGTVRIGARFVLDGKWFYQVVYLIGKAHNQADAEHFLKSFKLIRE